MRAGKWIIFRVSLLILLQSLWVHATKISIHRRHVDICSEVSKVFAICATGRVPGVIFVEVRYEDPP